MAAPNQNQKHAKAFVNSCPLLLHLFFLYLFTICPLFATHHGGGCLAQSSSSSMNQTELAAVLQDLRRNGFLTAVAILSFVPSGASSSIITPPVTLLVPTDEALGNISSISNLAPSGAYSLLLPYHQLRGSLSSRQLGLLPVGTWIPTFLPQNGVQVTSNGNGAGAGGGLALDYVDVVDPDICPAGGPAVSCHGMAGILLPTSPVSQLPTGGSPAAAPGPSPGPGVSSPLAPGPGPGAPPPPPSSGPSPSPGVADASSPPPSSSPTEAPSTAPPPVSPPAPAPPGLPASSTSASPADLPSAAPPSLASRALPRFLRHYSRSDFLLLLLPTCVIIIGSLFAF